MRRTPAVTLRAREHVVEIETKASRSSGAQGEELALESLVVLRGSSIVLAGTPPASRAGSRARGGSRPSPSRARSPSAPRCPRTTDRDRAAGAASRGALRRASRAPAPRRAPPRDRGAHFRAMGFSHARSAVPNVITRRSAIARLAHLERHVARDPEEPRHRREPVAQRARGDCETRARRSLASRPTRAPDRRANRAKSDGCAGRGARRGTKIRRDPRRRPLRARRPNRAAKPRHAGSRKGPGPKNPRVTRNCFSASEYARSSRPRRRRARRRPRWGAAT